MRERATKQRSWTGREVSMMAGFFQLLEIKFEIGTDDWKERDTRKENGWVWLTSWTQQTGHRIDRTVFWIKKETLSEDKRYKVHGARYGLVKMAEAFGHDIECACDSCIGWIESTVKDNVSPDHENDAKAYINRLYGR